MQVTRELNVSKQELYAYIYKMLHEDVKEISEKDTSIGVGFSYQKQLHSRMGKPLDVTTTIQALELGEYAITITSIQGTNLLRYTYSEIDDTKIKVVYEELFEGINTSGSINHSILSFFTRRANKKRMHNVLQQLETIIIQER